MAQFYVDGKYVEEAQAALPLSDMAILRGYAVFDFLRTYNGKPFHLEEHLHRLANSAEILHIHFPWELEEVKGIVNKLLEVNGYEEANIRFIVTGGDSTDSITPENKPRLVVMVTPLKSFPSEWYSDGVKVITTEATRYRPGSKSTNYIKAIVALKDARAENAIESIYVNENGELLEGTTSNFFVVIDGKIITPGEEILPGITRDVVLCLAARNFPVEQAAVTRDMIKSCSEAFLTSSNKEVAPIISLDDIKISAAPGPVTREVMKLFREYTASW